MSNSGKPFTTVTLEDRTFAVVRTDPRKPQFLEVIALFLDASRARTARIAPFGSAIAGKETAHQNRACRLRPRTGRLPGFVMHNR